MDDKLKALIDAPLADPSKIYLPEGKRRAPCSRRAKCHDEEMPGKLTTAQLVERKRKRENEKLEALFDYYATTNLTATKVAEHMGLYRSEQTGVDDAGKPTFARVLDVERAEAQLRWRRKAA